MEFIIEDSSDDDVVLIELTPPKIIILDESDSDENKSVQGNAKGAIDKGRCRFFQRGHIRRKGRRGRRGRKGRKGRRLKNTSENKEHVSSNANINVLDQGRNISENDEMNCVAFSPAKTPSIEDTLLVDYLPSSYTNIIVEDHAASITSKLVRAAFFANTEEIDPNNSDYVPLTENNERDLSPFDSNNNSQLGISRFYYPFNFNINVEEERASSPENFSSEAEVYLTDFQSSYLVSSKGQEFLRQISLQSNVQARLKKGSIGYVLILFGLPSGQDKFHSLLLEKYRELPVYMRNERLKSLQVPKNSKKIVNFLRGNIKQLRKNLGDVNELQNKIGLLELQQTNKNLKLAEKYRRRLNMILLGQAGLCGGVEHLVKLLKYMKTLTNSYKINRVAPNLRKEIDTHFRAIFTSYDHGNYLDLIQSYNNITTKN